MSFSPVLTFVSEELHPNVYLDGVLLIACQHLLEPNRELFEVLFSKGLKPQDTYVIGKCYSTNFEVAKALKERGANVSEDGWTFDSHRSFDEQFAEYISNFLKRLQNDVDVSSYKKIVVLDDGGALIEAMLHNPTFNRMVAIEQTSSGYNRLYGRDLQFPVVNVARSWAKLEVETPFIARLVVDNVKERISRYVISCPKILVVSQGPVGGMIKEQLNSNFLVNGCDIVNGKCDFGGTFKNEFANFNVIIGATGAETFSVEERKAFNQPTLLVSAASSDREFPSLGTRQQTKRTDDCHLDVEQDSIVLTNSGFPINFTGEAFSLPAKEAQFTMGLLLSAVCQAMDTDAALGFCDLDATNQYQIVQFFRSLGSS